MFSDKNTNVSLSDEEFDLEAEMLEQVEAMEAMSEEEDRQEQATGDVSMPNLVDLSVSTPTKPDTTVKEEPVSSSGDPASPTGIVLPDLATDEIRKRARSPHLFPDEDEITESVTLESETRSPDTPECDTSDVRTPTPMRERSPPSKVRRSARNLNKN